jgi:hypothetical protein
MEIHLVKWRKLKKYQRNFIVVENMDIKEKIEKVEELRYEISKRTIDLYKIKTAKEYDKEREKIKELKKNFEKLLGELEREITYIFFNKGTIEKLKENFSKLSEEERKKAINENSGLIKNVSELLKKNSDNKAKISEFIMELNTLPESERRDLKDFFECEKNYLKIKTNLKTLKEICELYGIKYKKSIFGDVELIREIEEKKEEREKKKEGKKENKEERSEILYKILPFLDKRRIEREKKIKEIDQEIESLDRRMKEILEREEMKRFSIGVFSDDEEQKVYDKLQEELLGIIKRKRELVENKKLLEK